MDRLKSLSETISGLIDEQFSGCIKINFSQGSIGRVEKLEELEEASLYFTGDKRDETAHYKERNNP
jgi:hypothetical protein